VSSYLIAEGAGGSPEPTPSLSLFGGDAPGALERALLQRLQDTPTTDTDYWLLFGLLSLFST